MNFELRTLNLEEVGMTVKAGDEARHTGDLRCRKCGELMHVEEGVPIPRCAVCNGEDFTLRNRPVPGT